MATPVPLKWGWLGALLALGWGALLRGPAGHLPAAQPTPQCPAAGTVASLQVPTAYLPGGEIRGLLYLPPCYRPDAQPGYPLLVLIHGQTFTPQQWLELGLVQWADAHIRQGRVQPFLVLMPYDPPPFLNPPENGFDEALMEDLLPWVQAHYPVRPERGYWAIGGISRGAAWAIRLGLTHWQRFGAIGGHSPPVFWSDGLLVRGWLQAIPEGQWPRIYLDIGDADREEILRSATEFEQTLTDLGVPHQWHFNVGRHDQAYWAAHLDQYLTWYTAPWAASTPSQEPPP